MRNDPRFDAILRGMGLTEMSERGLARLRARRECSRPSPGVIRCTELETLQLSDEKRSARPLLLH